jgi:hypothetical protein
MQKIKLNEDAILCTKGVCLTLLVLLTGIHWVYMFYDINS